MLISLDTNVWIFGLVGTDEASVRILRNLAKFQVVVPNQIRAELKRNLSDFDMKQFYQLVLHFEVTIDFTDVPLHRIAAFENKGLKKGDAEIGAYCEWRQVDVIVSHNRDFLRGLSAENRFDVMSPHAFCETFGL